MVDSSAVSFSVKIVSHKLVNDEYATYLIKVLAPKNISFHIDDRYSSIRSFQSSVKKNIKSVDGVPQFPKKKYWGHMDPAFLKQR